MLSLSVGIIFITGLAAPYLLPRLGRAAPWLFSLIPLGILAGLLTHIIGSVSTFPWVESLGLTILFRAEGLSYLFAVLITGIGAVVTLYSGGYFHGDSRAGRWFCFLFLFMGSMLGLVLSDNVFSLFVFWELTSITSFLLIGFDHHRPEARAAALQSLLVTAGGGLSLLAGLVLLALITHTTDLGAMVAAEIPNDSPLLPWVAALILIGAATKSAQIPFQFWLPNAMTAPTPASAFLHSSTMVKAGVFLLFRLQPLFESISWWGPALMLVGGLTALTGAWMAVRQHVLKPLLAWSTVSSLGLMVMLIGAGTPEALFAAAVFILAHALYKAALFLVAGILDHETGERDIRRLGGLRQDMPITAITATLSGLSMAGIPLTAGFVAKESMYETLLHAPAYGWMLLVCAVLAGASFAAVAWSVSVKPFHGSRLPTDRHAHDPGSTMFFGPLMLSGLGIAAGTVPSLLLEPHAAASAPTAHHVPHLAAWHGFNLPLLLSAITLALGGVVIWLRHRKAAGDTSSALNKLGTERLYYRAMDLLDRFSTRTANTVQHGLLRIYLFSVLLGAMAILWPLVYRHAAPLDNLITSWAASGAAETRWHEWALLLTMIMAIGATVHARTRLGAVTALGVVGYVIAVIFVLYGAPDLAMTQFVIETLTVILIALSFSHLPPFRDLSPLWVRARDLLFAVTGGVVMTVLTLVALNARKHESVAAYYMENSYNLAHGKNVVNVILVDFRGIDTLGEITVLAIAALGTFALLRTLPGRKRGETP